MSISSAVTNAANVVANVGKNLVPSLTKAAHGFSSIMNNAEQNSAWSAAQARELRAWQEQQNQKAMDFNAAEAAKNRDWQKMMSDTAHQREVKDLLAAGLNPVLSVTGGNGASVGSGAMASGVTSSGAMGSPDTSLNAAIASLFGTLIDQQTAMNTANTNAITNLAVADKYNAMSKYTAELQSQTQLNTATINAMATRYSAEVHANASEVVAAINSAAAKYGYDVNAMTQKEIASFNAEVNKELKDKDIKASFDLQDSKYGFEMALKQMYPNTLPGMAGSFVGGITDLLTGTGSYASTAKDVADAVYSKVGRSFVGGASRGGYRASGGKY